MMTADLPKISLQASHVSRLQAEKGHSMIRVIYQPAVDELIPDIVTYYRLPVSGLDVLDVLVPDDWDTDGTVLYSSDNFDEDGYPILLAEQFIHHYAGWEV